MFCKWLHVLFSTDYDPIRDIWILTKIHTWLQCGTPLHPLVDQSSIAAGFTIIKCIYHGGGIKSDWGQSLHHEPIPGRSQTDHGPITNRSRADHGPCTSQLRASRFKLSEIRCSICIGNYHPSIQLTIYLLCILQRQSQQVTVSQSVLSLLWRSSTHNRKEWNREESMKHKHRNSWD